MSSKDEVEYLAKRLATRGYVVAAPEFPLTNLTTPGGARFVDLANQPRDVSFVIDQLEAHHGAADSLLFGAIDKKRIALSGTSLGGATTLLATYHPKLRDPRVVAAVSFAGLAAAFTDKMYAAGSARVLLLHGVIDALLDYQANAVAAHQRAAGRAGLITFATGTHTGFAGSAALLDSLTHNVDTVGCKAIASATPKPEEIVDLVKALGGADAGVQIPVMPPPCATNPLPDGMKPQRQAQLTMLAATSFFELHFASDAIARASACRFLTETLAKEQQGVTYAP
jgi:dienelactone hydrolase